jgi:hypothetical protein
MIVESALFETTNYYLKQGLTIVKGLYEHKYQRYTGIR